MTFPDFFHVFHGCLKVGLWDKNLCLAQRNTNKSGVTGQGMKEAQNINKSLSALGDVIQSLVVTLLQFLRTIFFSRLARDVGEEEDVGSAYFFVKMFFHCEEIGEKTVVSQ